MASIKKYNGSSFENAAIRKYSTASEIITPPTTIYADGSNITTYTIKGNTVQNGTPTPSNPVEVNGVGERTENIITNRITGAALNSSGVVQNATDYDLLYGKVEPNKTYTIQLISSTIACVFGYFTQEPVVNGVTYDGSRTVIDFNEDPTPTVTIPTGVNYIAIRVNSGKNVMVNEGSTIKPYEPIGYKIPISSASTTTPVYLGEVETTRKIKKYIFDGTENWRASSAFAGGFFCNNLLQPCASMEALCSHFENTTSTATYSAGQFVLGGTDNVNVNMQQSNTSWTADDFKTWLAQEYANGTPVTVWYVLATPETATVNEPLMKIGTYADTLSNATAIPTTEGANTITVDTTVQPSEFTATWTGWHDASVKEKSENLFNTFDIVGQVPSISNGQLINYNGSTTSLIPIISGNITVTKPPTALLYLLLYAADMSYIGYVQNSTDANFYGSSVTGYENAKYCRLRIDRATGLDDIQIMINTGSTALPYEPYWK